MNKSTEELLHRILSEVMGRYVRIYPDEDIFMDGILTSYSISDGILRINLHNECSGSFSAFKDNDLEYHRLDRNDYITLISDVDLSREFPTRISILRYINEGCIYGYR